VVAVLEVTPNEALQRAGKQRPPVNAKPLDPPDRQHLDT